MLKATIMLLKCASISIPALLFAKNKKNAEKRMKKKMNGKSELLVIFLIYYKPKTRKTTPNHRKDVLFE